jgi:DNA polymerase I-like protein with 3'-5' exonuclease and polymerase domains
MNRLSRMALDNNKWHLHPILNIHDDLTFIVPEDYKLLDQAVELITAVMLRPKYDFINVPLSVEASCGYNWYEMREIGKFWSHKDD